jgi:hypothetical protein
VARAFGGVAVIVVMAVAMVMTVLIFMVVTMVMPMIVTVVMGMLMHGLAVNENVAFAAAASCTHISFLS